MSAVQPLTAAAIEAPRGPSIDWDRRVLLVGALLVPVPILAYLGLRAAGVPLGVSEDLVTLLVMVPLGGPHVFATFTRTLLNPRFWREGGALRAASLLIFGIAVTAAVTSAFFDVRVAGAPPMAWLLTLFFLWAGLHVLQQHCYVAACLADRVPHAPRDRWHLVDHAVMLLSLYPVSLFRMSMADPRDPALLAADPDALATRIVLGLGASPEFAGEYVFRIGRAAPILPDCARHPACWMLLAAALAVSFLLFLGKSWRAHRRGVPLGARFRLVLTVAVLGAVVPLVPNLDSAFQGINAWHSFQYLGLAWFACRHDVARGKVSAPFLVGLVQPGRALRAYGVAIAGTLSLIAVILAAAVVLQWASAGRFVLFGHDVPPTDPATGTPLYRPGAILLAYYLFGFSFLLVHYLQDSVFFLRRRLGM